jgi:hypothetical protein
MLERELGRPPSSILKTCKKMAHPSEDTQTQHESATPPDVET